jgi:general secretion pathway protein H
MELKVATETIRTSLLGSSRRGFSLLELMLVLVLVGAVSAVVVPSFIQGMAGVQLETATRDLVTQFRQARTRAVSTQRVYRVLLQPSQVPGEPSSYALADEYEHPIRTFPLPEVVSFAGAGEPGWSPVISFYPNGRSSSGRVVMAAGNRRMTIVMNPITGFGSAERVRDRNR